MTRNPHRDRNVIAWASAVLTAYTIIVSCIAVAVIHDPVRWIPPAFFAAVAWLLLAVYCCVLIEEAARRQRRARITVPDAQMRYRRLPAAVSAERAIPFDEYADEQQDATAAADAEPVAFDSLLAAWAASDEANERIAA